MFIDVVSYFKWSILSSAIQHVLCLKWYLPREGYFPPNLMWMWLPDLEISLPTHQYTSFDFDNNLLKIHPIWAPSSLMKTHYRYSPAKCYARLSQVIAHSLVMDHAPCITTGSAIRIVQGSEHAVILSHINPPLFVILLTIWVVNSMNKFSRNATQILLHLSGSWKNVWKQM